MHWTSPIPGAKWLKDLQTGEWATEPLSPLGSTTTFDIMMATRQHPLSSRSILSAINNGIIVADRIAKNFSQKDSGFDDYDKNIKVDFCNYLIKRKYYYNLEKR